MTMKKIPDDAIVRLIDLPPGIGGAVMEDEDGFVSIYVNARHGHYAQLDDLDHEIAHIENDDLHNDDSIEVVEARADGLPSSLKPIPHLMRARDLLPQPTDAAAAPAPPPSESNPPISPYQATVLLRAINDLDDWLFRDATYDI